MLVPVSRAWLLFISTQLGLGTLQADTPVHAPRLYNQQNVDVAMSPQGRTWFAWESPYQLSKAARVEVVGIAYDAQRSPIVGEFIVNTTTESKQTNPFVMARPDESALIVWDHQGTDAVSYGVYGGSFDAQGNASRTEFAVNAKSDAWGTARNPQVAQNSKGVAVVVSKHEKGMTAGLTAQHLSAAGGLDGPSYWVDSGGGWGRLNSPAVTVFSDGSYCTVFGTGRSKDKLLGRIVSASRKPGPRFEINQQGVSSEYHAAVAGNGKRFVVAWQSKGMEKNATYTDVFIRLFDSAGHALSPEVRVNDHVEKSQEYPDVAMLPDGRFIVVWSGDGPDSDWSEVYARKFDASGKSLGAPYRINEFTSYKQQKPAIAMNASGAHVVAWEDLKQERASGNKKNGAGIYARWFSSFEDSTGQDGTAASTPIEVVAGATPEVAPAPQQDGAADAASESAVDINCVNPEITRVKKVSATKGEFDDRVVLKWQPAKGATGYAIYRNGHSLLSVGSIVTNGSTFEQNHPLHTDLLIGQTAANVFEFVDYSADEEAGTTLTTAYFYWVKAIQGNCVGLPNAHDSGFTAPRAVSQVSATRGKHKGRVEVSYESVRGGVFYELYRSEEKDFSGAERILRATVSGGRIGDKKSGISCKLTDKSAISGTHYFYAVRVIGLGGTQAKHSGPVEGWAQ